jgi:hypothetical protein
MSDTNKPNKIPPPESSDQAPNPPPAWKRKFSQEEWIRRLKELGARDATLDPGGPTAFELPGFPDPSLSQKSQPDKPTTPEVPPDLLEESAKAAAELNARLSLGLASKRKTESWEQFEDRVIEMFRVKGLFKNELTP